MRMLDFLGYSFDDAISVDIKWSDILFLLLINEVSNTVVYRIKQLTKLQNDDHLNLIVIFYHY